MRYLYYCNSAYQLITILNLHWHRKNAGFENIVDYDGDIIVLNAFEGAEEIVDILNHNNVFGFAKLINKKFNTGSLHALSTFSDLMIPNKYIRKYGFDDHELDNRYDILQTPKYNQIMASIWQVNPKAELHLFEDGVGTYFLATDLRSRSKIYRLFYKLFNHNKDFEDYKKVYLYEPDLFVSDKKTLLVTIPKINGDCAAYLKELFSDYITKDNNKDIFWLAQYFVQDDINNICKDAVEVLKEFSDRVLYCPHPRHPYTNDSFEIANLKRIWELQLLEYDMNNCLLVTFHSTACISPKLLYDYEPYIIFVYPGVSSDNIAKYKEFYEFMDKFREIYRDSEKIMLASNSEELRNCVLRFIEK